MRGANSPIMNGDPQAFGEGWMPRQTIDGGAGPIYDRTRRVATRWRTRERLEGVAIGVRLMAPSGGGREHGLLHLIGKDRVGILQEAAAFVQERGGTLEEGISHTLSTEAVALLYISGTSEQMDLVERDSPRLGDALELVALFTRIRKPDLVRNRDALPLTLRVSSSDCVGLLEAMTRFFTRHALPIVAHHTRRAPVSHNQTQRMYMHKFTVLLPPEFKRKAFLAELDTLASELQFIRDDISHSDFY